MSQPVPAEVPLGSSAQAAEWERALEYVREWLATHAGNSRVGYADALGYPLHPETGARRDVSRLRNGVAWLPWCAAHGVPPLHATRRHVLAWIEAIAKTPHPRSGRLLSKTSRAHMVSAVSSFYTYTTQDGHTAANPVQINRKKLGLATAADTSPTRSLTRDEVAALQQAADADRITAQRPRSSALIAVLFEVGLRVSELVGLRLADMGVMQGARVLWLTLKGSRRHVVVLPADAAGRVDAYLGTRTDLDTRPAVPGAVNPSSPPLFATATGKPVQRSEVLRLVRRLAKQAGLASPDTIHPHTARHTWITTAREVGIEPSVIQDHVGHVDGKTTARYGRHALSVADSPVGKVADAYARARPQTDVDRLAEVDAEQLPGQTSIPVGDGEHNAPNQEGQQ